MERLITLVTPIISVMFFTACGQKTDASELPQVWQTETITQNGIDRVFRYYIPDELSDPFPVVMVIHGGGGNMNRIFEPDANAIPKWVELAEQPVPMLIMNGTKDPLMPYDGGSIPGGRGNVASSSDTRDFWISVNGADPSDPEITEYPDLDPDDGSRVICEDYEPLQAGAGAPVRYCRVEGGGHIMPTIDYTVSPGRQNRDIESAEVAWEFFSRVASGE